MQVHESTSEAIAEVDLLLFENFHPYPVFGLNRPKQFLQGSSGPIILIPYQKKIDYYFSFNAFLHQHIRTSVMTFAYFPHLIAFVLINAHGVDISKPYRERLLMRQPAMELW